MNELSIIDDDYVTLINEIKQKVKKSQLRAHRAVNTEIICLYWSIGKQLLKRQKLETWGAKYLDQVSKDLKAEFPGPQGFSTTNLKYMIMLAHEYSDFEIGQQAVDQLPWGHIVRLIQ